MKTIKLVDILPNLELVDSYLTFRYIEEWCTNNIPKDKWKFSYAGAISAYGVIIPGSIFFWSDEDATKFRLQYRVISPEHPID